MWHTVINVSRNGKHFFRVELGKNGNSDGNLDNVAKVFQALTEAFPDCNVSAMKQNLMFQRYNPIRELENQ